VAAASAESCSQVMPFEASLSALMPERVLLARVGWVKHRTHKYLSGNPSSPPGWHRRFQKGFKWEPRRQHIDLIQVKWHSPLGEILSFRSKVTGSECLTKRHDEANQYALQNRPDCYLHKERETVVIKQGEKAVLTQVFVV